MSANPLQNNLENPYLLIVTTVRMAQESCTYPNIRFQPWAKAYSEHNIVVPASKSGASEALVRTR